MARGSNPTPSNRRPAYKGGGVVKGNSAMQKRAGTGKLPGIPMADGPTKARAVTMTGVGTEDKNPPESGRARQDAARGTVHGQPKSHFNAGN
jgi:hypothetical protein